jgi:chemotaxis protein CheX
MSGDVLLLPERLDLAAAAPLAEALRARAGRDLVLDAKAVSHIGAMGLQVLRSAAKSWASSGHRLELRNLSDACTDQLALLGYAPDEATRWEDET